MAPIAETKETREVIRTYVGQDFWIAVYYTDGAAEVERWLLRDEDESFDRKNGCKISTEDAQLLLTMKAMSGR